VVAIKTESLTLGEKLRAVRKAQNMSLENLEELANFHNSRLSRIETSNHCPPDTLTAIRIALKIQDAPLLDEERESFERGMRTWCILIDEGKYDDAKEMQSAFSSIVRLPYEHDYIVLYKIFKARLLYVDDEIGLVKKLLSEVEPYLENASERVMYHYSYTNGNIKYAEAKYDAAFYSYFNAYKLRSHAYADSPWLYYCLAISANRMGWLSNSINLVHEACVKYKDTKLSTFSVSINNILAMNYIGLNIFTKAEELLSTFLLEAKNQNNKLRIARAYINYSHLNCKQKDWRTAITYANKALEHAKQGSQSHFEAIYQKSRALIGLGNTVECKTLLADAKELAKDNENYYVQFKALECLLTINDEQSIAYIEYEAIPYFIKTHQIGPMLLDFCEQLMKQLEKSNAASQKRKFRISVIINQAYINMTCGGELK